MREQLRGFKLLSAVALRKQRSSVYELERQLDEITTTVDEFYSQLGGRNWIFHDDLDLGLVSAMVRSGRPGDDAEAQFIEEQYTENRLSFMIGRLASLPAMRVRMDLIQKALVDYRAARFYSTVLVLIAVMDGFVNDLDPANRKGLHARDETELNAWDSVVGHHAGLGRAHRTFTRSFGKTQTEPVFELHRNGIVHGNLTNFDNIVVAAKAWNRLFAVADWAHARTKQSEPVEQPTRWRDVFKQLAETERTKKNLDAWSPSVLVLGDDGFAGHPAYVTVAAFLDAWQHQRWGLMAQALPLATQRQHAGQVGRAVKDMYSSYELQGYVITQLDFVAAAVCECSATIALETGEISSVSRWIHEAEESEEPTIPPRFRCLATGPVGRWGVYQLDCRGRVLADLTFVDLRLVQ